MMTLLVLAPAYIVGVWIASLLMRAGLLGCNLPDWMWMVPLASLPLTPLPNGAAVVDNAPMRWPESAGFTRPRQGIRRGLVVAALLRGMMVDDGVMTAVATILTLPLVAFHFQRVNMLGVLDNLLSKWY
jgi:hypothetical protein